MQREQTSFTHPVLDRAIYLLSKRTLFGETSGEKLGKKLEEKFRYFLSAFITLALANGATVPLSIADDQHASLQTFIKHGGPKHIIDMMKSHLDKNELMRASLALLIVVVNLLRNKLSNALLSMEDLRIRDVDLGIDVSPNTYGSTRSNSKAVGELSRSDSTKAENGDEDEGGGPAAAAREDEASTQRPAFTRSDSSAPKLVHRATLHAVAQRKTAAAAERRALQSVIEWTTLALHAFSDAGRSATMCVTVLVSNAVPSVQQLSLTLLALLVTVCSTSARRMLQPHSTAHEAARSKRDASPEGKGEGNSAAASKANGGREIANLDNPERGKGKVKRVTTPLELTLKNAFASTLSFPLIAKRLGVYVQQNDRSVSKRLRGLKDGSKSDATASCMSYILTVAARENSPVAMAGCAEIVLAMTIEDEILHPTNSSSDFANDSASTNRGSYSYKAARTPTCALSAGDAASSQGSSAEGGKKKGVQPTPAQGVQPLDDAGDKKIPYEEWVGVKIFLRFLARNIRYFERGSGDSQDHEEGAADRNRKPLRKKTSSAAMDKGTELLGRGGISSQQLQGLVYAFHKAIAALSSLITMSPKVAVEVASMHGADDVLRASVNGLAALVSSDGTGMVSLADCKHLTSLAYNAARHLCEEKEGRFDHEDHRRSSLRHSILDASPETGTGTGTRNEMRPKTTTTETSGSVDSEKLLSGAAGGSFGAAVMSKAQKNKKVKQRPQTTDAIQKGRNREYAIYVSGDGNVLAGPGQSSVPKNWTGDMIKAPRTGGLSPVANDRPLSSQFGQKYRNDVAYSMPEYPTRRGLSPKHLSRDDGTSLHKVVFQSIHTPGLPCRLEPEDVNQIVDDLQHRDELRGRKVLNAVRKLDKVAKSAELVLTAEGFTYNGQHSVPQLERARRIYHPTGQPISWEMQESGELGNNSTSFVFLGSQGASPQAENGNSIIKDLKNRDLVPISGIGNQANSPNHELGNTLERAQEMAPVSRIIDDGLKHKAFIESMIKVTQSAVTASADVPVEVNSNQALNSMAVSTAANAINLGTEQVMSRPSSAGDPVVRPPISVAIGVASNAISAGTERVLSRPSSAQASDLSFGMHADDFNFDIPNILEMAPIYSIGGLDTDTDLGKPEDSDSVMQPESNLDDQSKRSAVEEEEDMYRAVSKTSKNVGGLVTSANAIDIEQAKGYGRVQKNPAVVGFAESAVGRSGEHMELLFPK